MEEGENSLPGSLREWEGKQGYKEEWINLKKNQTNKNQNPNEPQKEKMSKQKGIGKGFLWLQ